MSSSDEWTAERDAVLCDETGELTTRFEDVLGEIFVAFDEDKDGVLSEAELSAYFSKCNGKPITKDELNEIQNAISVDDKGRLTRAGFIEIYALQTPCEPMETWRDLTTHGYDAALNKKSDAPCSAAAAAKP